MFFKKEKYVFLNRTKKTIFKNTMKTKSTLLEKTSFNNKSFQKINYNKKQIINNYTLLSIGNKLDCSKIIKFHYNYNKNFSEFDKFRDSEIISIEEFTMFISNFQNGELDIANFPKNYKKYLKEIKLLPSMPEEPEDCCGKECNPCTIEFYHEKIDRRSYMINDLYKKIYINKSNDICEGQNSSLSI